MWRDVSGTVGGGRSNGSNGSQTVVSSDTNEHTCPECSQPYSPPESENSDSDDMEIDHQHKPVNSIKVNGTNIFTIRVLVR